MFNSEEASREYRREIVYSRRPCSELRLAVGSWVKIEGRYEPSARVAAQNVITYEWSNDEVATNDGAILEETPTLKSGTKDTIWLNGFPIMADSQTEIREAPPRTRLVAGKDGFYSFHSHQSGLGQPPRQASFDDIKAGQCMTYRVDMESGGSLSAKALLFWDCVHNRGVARSARSLSERSWAPPDYVRGTPGTVDVFATHLPFRRKPKGISILPDRAIQEYVDRVGISVLPEYAKPSVDTNSDLPHFHFEVVRSLGKFANYAHFVNGIGNLKYEDCIVPFPDGLILVPADAGITHLQNEAQLAAVLSIAVTKVLQRQDIMAGEGIANLDLAEINPFGTWQEAQALRTGIHQLYRAGYDIREAPFAWMVASGKAIPNPVIEGSPLDSTAPWYAAYAFDYISRYYSDVDYSKLKRGEKEYAAFLDELRKADPDAFTEK